MGNRIDKVLQALEEIPGEVKVIAIDGRCASGKSTLAQQLAGLTGAGIIHMDDFFLPRELRTEERLTEEMYIMSDSRKKFCLFYKAEMPSLTGVLSAAEWIWER